MPDKYNLQRAAHLLFDQLERISNDDLKEETLKFEADRALSMTRVTRELIEIAKVTLDARRSLHPDEIGKIPRIIGSATEKTEA